MKKGFVTAYPSLFLTPVEYELGGRKILHIYVPIGTWVSRCSGRIYDRNNESDIDITDNEELVYKLYARKQGTYNNHLWLSMDDEELLRSAGLILLDHDSRREGITLAAILLFGKDST